MYTVLLSRTYVLPSLGTLGRTVRVSLLQDTDTFALRWEVAVLVRTSKGLARGSITRRKTRTDAMRLVRELLYAA